MREPLPIAAVSNLELGLLPALANRHGCITGATGTGKTVTLQRLAEQLSRIGVPVFLADVKGDLGGLAAKGTSTPKVKERFQVLGRAEPEYAANPVTFWDVWGEQGHPVRATVSDMGPLLLARLLNLNATQEGVLTLAFKVADDRGLLLLDMKDLRALLQFVGENQAEFRTAYGNISAASVGAIQRSLMQLEQQGGAAFFGEPMLDVNDLLQTDAAGRGVINVLAADKLLQTPRVYAAFLLWLLAELYEQLPEVGDLEKPKLVFFDEAHLLFDDAPKALLEKIEQVVRLIRSKGVGVYFVTQNPLDIPESVLAQLGNRVQHALRAFTPREQKAVRAVAETMRVNPALDIRTAITELAVGEALISFLDQRGTPGVTERALVIPPASRIGPLTAEERRSVIQGSLVAGVYEKVVDRDSAFERLQKNAASRGPSRPADQPSSEDEELPIEEHRNEGEEGGGVWGGFGEILFGRTGPRGGRQPGVIDSMANSAARSMGSAVAREITRGIFGSLLGGARPRRRRR